MPQRHALRPPSPVRGVLFDLHSTLVDQGSAEEWLDLGLARHPHQLTPEERADLVTRLDRIWERARETDPDSLRDKSADDHYRVFHELLSYGPGLDRRLGDALHAVLLDTWHAYDDAIPTLRALREAGVRVGIISNIGLDITHVLDREGLLGEVDGVVLSRDVGSVKPDLPIFEAAMRAIDCEPHETLMVGDSGKDDAGATVIGVRTLILPRTRGPVHGLRAVADFVLATQAR